MGKTLEFSGDGRMRLSQEFMLGEQWTVQEKKKKGRYLVHIVDPASGDRIRTVQLDVGRRTGQQLIETNLDTGEELQMTFVSRGHQSQEPAFLGRWQFMLTKFGIPAVYEYTEDGWVWLRAPIHAELGTYTMDGDRIVAHWSGAYSPLVDIHYERGFLVATNPEGAQERFLPPKLLETLTTGISDPRK